MQGSSQIQPEPITIVIDSAGITAIAFLAAGTVAGLKFLLGRAIAQIDKKMAEMNERLKKIEDVEDMLQNYKAQAAREYVTREEWVRAVTVSDAKLDAVHRRLDQISDRIMLILSRGEHRE